MRSVFLFSEGLDPLGFRMKSKAPSMSASVVTWAPAAVSRLIITTLVRMRRRLSSLRTSMPSMPLMSGLSTSRVTRSGWSSLNNRTASFPLAASATTVQPREGGDFANANANANAHSHDQSIINNHQTVHIAYHIYAGPDGCVPQIPGVPGRGELGREIITALAWQHTIAGLPLDTVIGEFAFDHGVKGTVDRAHASAAELCADLILSDGVDKVKPVSASLAAVVPSMIVRASMSAAVALVGEAIRLVLGRSGS